MKILLRVIVTIALLISISASVFGEDKSSEESKETQKHSKKKRRSRKRSIRDPHSGCLVNEIAIADLEKLRDQLAEREEELERREKELSDRESALESELLKIQGVRDQIKKEVTLQSKDSEAKVAKLVETFEKMSPKTGAKLLANMDETLAVSAMMKISTPKLAKIMNGMKPEKASRLSEILAGVARAKQVNESHGSSAAAIERKEVN